MSLTWEEANKIAKGRPSIDGVGLGLNRRSPDYSGLVVNGTIILEPGEPKVYGGKFYGTWKILRPCGCTKEVSTSLLQRDLQRPCKDPECPTTTVHGVPCRSCGGTLRYRKAPKGQTMGICVVCHRESKRKSRRSLSGSVSAYSHP